MQQQEAIDMLSGLDKYRSGQQLWADLIVALDHQRDFLNRNNFTEIDVIDCIPKKLPFLPDSFYGRSIYPELFFTRSGTPRN